MTTLVALPTKDAVVMGCDSLATASVPLVNPMSLWHKYFDDEGAAVLEEDGIPKLRQMKQILDEVDQVPFNHMTHVDKLFWLKPLPLGVMFSGITSIDDRTIKGLVRDFIHSDKAFASPVNYTVNSVARRLLAHFKSHYDKAFKERPPTFRPVLELILAGYSKTGHLPCVVKIDVGAGKAEEQQPPFWPVFGGQSREIQRIVYGVDFEAYVQLEVRHRETARAYAEDAVRAHGLKDVELPEMAEEHKLWAGDFTIPGIGGGDWADFSEQNAIDCVAYFIRIMSQGQRFSPRMPTVGGDIHVALIDREEGFRFISREEYAHEDHRVQRS